MKKFRDIDKEKLFWDLVGLGCIMLASLVGFVMWFVVSNIVIIFG